MPRSAHRLPGRSLLALALALPAVALVAPAHAVDAPSVTASGHVTDDNATAVSGVQVVAYALSATSSSGSSWVPVAPIGTGNQPTTDTSGNWSIKLPPGSYEFEYRTSAYADQYDADAAFIDQGTATAFADAGATHAFTAALHQRATLEGTVKDALGNALSGATVTVQYRPKSSTTWRTATTATTNASGAWTAAVAPTTPANTSYQVMFSAPTYKSAYYTGAGHDASVDPADEVLLGTDVLAGGTDDLGTTTLVDSSAMAGTLAGTVRAADGSVPAGQIQLYTETITTSASGARHDVWAASGAPVAVTNGSYSLDRPAGTYRIAFFRTDQAPVFYPSGQDLTTATNLTVSAGRTTAANITLPRPGTVTGHVTYASLPADATISAEAPYVSAIDNGVPSISYVEVASPTPSNLTTGSDAAYSISLPAGTWVIAADDHDATNGPEAYYPNAASAATAQMVTVTAGATVADVDIEMAPAPASLSAATFTVTPSISGTVAVGKVLTADPGVWLPATASGPTYHWLADGIRIKDAQGNDVTGPTYTLTTAEVGKRISVEVTVPKAGLQTLDGTATSAATAWVPTVVSQTTTTNSPSGLAGLLTSLLGGTTTTTVTKTTTATSPSSSVAPAISGTVAVGHLLSASPGTWSAAEQSSVQYQWYADGQVIPWANSNRHVVTAADTGHALTLKAWFTDLSNNLTGSATSAATARVATPTLANQVAPRISGIAAVGQTLTAEPGTWTPSPTSFTYQWLAGGSPIGGATGSTYVVRSADAGKRISVAVTPVRTGYVTAATASAQTAAVPGATTGGGGTASHQGSAHSAKVTAVLHVRTRALTHGTVRVIVRLSAAGGKSFSGVLVARIGSHRGSAIAHRGIVRLVLSHVPRGKRLLRVVLRGSSTVNAATVVTWVKVKG